MNPFGSGSSPTGRTSAGKPNRCSAAPLLRACAQAQGRLLGMLGAVGSDTEVQSSLYAMLQNIVT